MQKKNFVGFEELPDAMGIKLYYQLIDKNTKDDPYIQDYHTLECKYIYDKNLRPIILYFNDDSIINKEIELNEDPEGGYSYFRLIPISKIDPEQQKKEKEKVLCRGLYYTVYTKQNWTNIDV